MLSHPKQPRAGGRLRLAAQSPSSLDPIRSQSYWESGIVLQLFDGLVRLDPSLNIVPAIAQDWSISPDGRVYQFDLRKGVRFHNGREVDSRGFRLFLLAAARSKGRISRLASLPANPRCRRPASREDIGGERPSCQRQIPLRNHPGTSVCAILASPGSSTSIGGSP